MFQQLFKSVSESEKGEAVQKMIEHSTPNHDFFLMVVLSVLMATFGLIINSPAVIVGSMLIAPILFPILGLALGITLSDFSLISRAFLTLIKAMFLCISIAIIVTLLFSSRNDPFTQEILSRTNPSLISAAIGAVAGLAAAFAITKPKINEVFPGIAISVALLPPLAVIGIGIARLEFEIALHALLLFIVNATGVILASTVTFSLMNLHTIRKKAVIIAKREDEKQILEDLSD